jgi:hypothetical protein
MGPRCRSNTSNMIKSRIAIVVIGILLPYLARLPGAVSRGPDWLWSYLGNGLVAALFFGLFNAIAWGAVLKASYSYRNPHSVWFAAVPAFVFLAANHAKLDLSSDAQAALGLLFIPIYSLPLIFFGWLAGKWFDQRTAPG